MPTFALNLYALIAAAAVSLGSLGYGAYEHQRAARYQVTEKAASDEVKRLQAAIESKEQVLAQMSAALQQWSATADASIKAMNSATDLLATLNTSLSEKQRAIAKLEEPDHALPNCQALLNTDIAQLCPGITAGLRLSAEYHLQRASGRPAGTSGNEAVSITH